MKIKNSKVKEMIICPCILLNAMMIHKNVYIHVGMNFNSNEESVIVNPVNPRND